FDRRTSNLSVTVLHFNSPFCRKFQLSLGHHRRPELSWIKQSLCRICLYRNRLISWSEAEDSPAVGTITMMVSASLGWCLHPSDDGVFLRSRRSSLGKVACV